VRSPQGLLLRRSLVGSTERSTRRADMLGDAGSLEEDMGSLEDEDTTSSNAGTRSP
jgi:hypothetical protein